MEQHPDKKAEPPPPAEIPAPSMDSPMESPLHKAAQKPKTSRGEKLFDWITYGGIAFLGVFVATIPWTYWTKHGGGRKLHDWMTRGLKKQGFSDSTAEQTFNTIVLGSLGNAAIVPVKIMENYKPELVDTFNDMLGDKTHAASVD